MHLKFHHALLAGGAIAIGATTSAALAQHDHADILVQRDGERLVTGTANLTDGQFTIGQRVFEMELDTFFACSDPGFNAVTGANVPAGYQALPGNTALSLSVVPQAIGSLSANLFYWDGMGEVSFGAVPAGNTFHLQRFSPAQDVIADGSNATSGPFHIQNTSAEGAVHFHPAYLLDGPGDAAPAAGIYLLPFQLAMSGLESSDTAFFVIHSGAGVSEEAHEAAVAWVEGNVVPEPSAAALALLGGIVTLARRGRRTA